jgi:hypothetical protein
MFFLQYGIPNGNGGRSMKAGPMTAGRICVVIRTLNQVKKRQAVLFPTIFLLFVVSRHACLLTP